ncbi:alpha/beta hydrolase fold protein [mine drainage metagenome]|uniref:Alpha/beta hydrolase fold protein n=1 Tax=mine drainage metagenome TaxID=410659 RepID=A0A1J5QRA4_9ZZZZ
MTSNASATPLRPAALRTREQFTAAYDNAAAVPAGAAIVAALRARGDALAARSRVQADQRYGALPRQRYDWYAAADADAPVLVFVHGGYWQARDKRDFSAVGAGALRAGLHVVHGEYTLAPQAGIGDMVAEIGQLLDALAAHPVLGRGQRLVLCGHSAGGHLAAMQRAHPAVAAVLAISGLFDLEPIRRGALNDALQPDAAAVQACSPLRRIGAGAPTVVAFGDAELPELQRQSRDYAAALGAAGQALRRIEVPGADHYTILAALERDDGVLLEQIVALAAGVER